MSKKGRKRGQLAVMVVCAVVGFLLAAQLRSVKLSGAADATNAARLETLQDVYKRQLHHHLEMGGWSEVKLVMVFTGITLLACLVAFWGCLLYTSRCV